MNFSSERLLWSEGTLLSQQHFQQWDKLQKSRDQFWYYLNKKRPREGFLNLDIEIPMLELGVFRINHFQAISKEGQALGFSTDLACSKLLELDLNKIECSNALKQGEMLNIYIAIPKDLGSHGVSGYPKKNIQKTRWVAEYKRCLDEMDVEREQEILFGCLNVQLLVDRSCDFEKRKLENDLIIAAKVVYSGAGRYALNNEFIPPILQLQASTWLINALRDMAIYLEFSEKSLIRAIENIKEVMKDIDNRGSHQVNEWCFRESLKVVSLLHYHIGVWLDNSAVDPDEVIHVMLKSAIKIRACSKNLGDSYNFLSIKTKNLHETFVEIFSEFKKIMQDILPVHQKNIILTEGVEPWISSEPLSEVEIETADLYLSALVNEDAFWIEQFVKEVKICGLNNIQRIITQALPGLPVTHCKENIKFIATNENRSFFKIDKNGSYWEDIKNTGKICIFVSKSFSGIDIKLVSLTEK